MRIFKRKFGKELTEGMSVGECIITRIDDAEYGNFIVHKKVSDGAFPYLGCFGLLQDAVTYVTAIEKPEDRFEYYLQFQAEITEGWDKNQLQVMGELGWELCVIQSNITDSEGKSMFIYKRKLQSTSISKRSLFIVAEDAITFTNSNLDIDFTVVDLRNMQWYPDIDKYLYNHIVILPVGESMLRWLDFKSLAYTEIYLRDSVAHKNSRSYKDLSSGNAVYICSETSLDISKIFENLQRHSEWVSGFNIGARVQSLFFFI